MAIESRYQSCTMSDLAAMAGVDLRTFQDWITREDMHHMFDLGWKPWNRKLTPPTVRYLRQKLIDTNPNPDQK